MWKAIPDENEHSIAIQGVEAADIAKIQQLLEGKKIYFVAKRQHDNQVTSSTAVPSR